MADQNNDGPDRDSDRDSMDYLFDEEALAAREDHDEAEVAGEPTALPTSTTATGPDNSEHDDEADPDPTSLFVPLTKAQREEEELRQKERDEYVPTKFGQPLPDFSIFNSLPVAKETHSYSLRPHSAWGPSTYLDQDKSGDYDPASEKMQNRPKKRKREVKFGPFLVSDDESEEDDGKGDSAPVAAPKLIVCLKFNSASAKQKLEDCIRGNDMKLRVAEFQKLAEGRRLRHRKGTQENTGHDETIEHILTHPTGHPASRGCIACLKLNQHCSILDNEKQFPCDGCKEVGEDCKLITTPIRKHPCDRCKRSGAYCSYEYTEDHSARCHTCEDGKHPCIAAPMARYTRTRIRLDHDWRNNPKPTAEMPPPAPTVWSCRACRATDRVCSMIFRGHQDLCEGPCTACEMRHLQCAPVLLADRTVALSATSSGPTRAMKKATLRATSSPTAVSAKPPPVTKTISTRLSYPIRFNAPETFHCAFCPPTSRPIVGESSRTIQVYSKPNDPALYELPARPEPLQVCVKCTTDRFCMATCTQHALVRIPNPTATNMADAQDAYVKLYQTRTVRAQDHWCSLCVNFADYICVTAGPRQKLLPSARGCGLMLCEKCRMGLEYEHFGDWTALLATMASEGPKGDRPLGFRADWELLKMDGLLVKFIKFCVAGRKK